jgi:hypothetical protein
MNSDLFNRLVNFLIPHVGGGQQLPAFVLQALHNNPVLHGIQLASTPYEFTVNFVRALERFDGAPSGYPALVSVLQALREIVGEDNKKKIDGFISELRGGGTTAHRDGTSTPPQRLTDEARQRIEAIQALIYELEMAALADDKEHLMGQLSLAAKEAKKRARDQQLADYKDQIRRLGG